MSRKFANFVEKWLQANPEYNANSLSIKIGAERTTVTNFLKSKAEFPKLEHFVRMCEIMGVEQHEFESGINMKSNGLTHFDDSGKAHMVDVSDKAVTSRIAVAEGYITMSPETLALVVEGRAEKGDVLGIARLAGIMGAKKTSDLIPLCHPLPITKVAVDLTPDADLPGIRISATVKTTGQTGVEMEALTAVSTAALTVHDMVKAVQKDMVIGGIKVTLKDGGKSGRYEVK